MVPSLSGRANAVEAVQLEVGRVGQRGGHWVYWRNLAQKASPAVPSFEHIEAVETAKLSVQHSRLVVGVNPLRAAIFLERWPPNNVFYVIIVYQLSSLKHVAMHGAHPARPRDLGFDQTLGQAQSGHGVPAH